MSEPGGQSGLVLVMSLVLLLMTVVFARCTSVGTGGVQEPLPPPAPCVSTVPHGP